MTKITIVSPFRDSDVDTYTERATKIDWPENDLRFICVEGDSVDSTYGQLLSWSSRDRRVTVIKCDTGLPRHGSVINPERMQILATVFNAGLDNVNLDWSDYVLFIPSDVIYEPDLISKLLAHDKDLIAPWYWTHNEHGIQRFYDTWGFCYQGGYFEQARKSWFDDRFPGVNELPMDTVGGVILMKKEVVEAGCRYTVEEVDRGLCKMARERGFEVWAALDVEVFHP